MPIPIIIGLIAKKKKQKEYARWTQAFPLSEDCIEVDNMILKAEEQWKQEDKEWRNTKKIKVQVRLNQKRERDTLRDYINDMRNYRKDLVCGISTPPAPMPAQVQSAAAVVNPPMSQETVLVPAQVINTGNKNAPGGGLALVATEQAPTDAVQSSNNNNNNRVETTITPSSSTATDKPTNDKKIAGLTQKQLLIGIGVVAVIGGAVYFMRKN